MATACFMESITMLMVTILSMADLKMWTSATENLLMAAFLVVI